MSLIVYKFNAYNSLESKLRNNIDNNKVPLQVYNKKPIKFGV